MDSGGLSMLVLSWKFNLGSPLWKRGGRGDLKALNCLRAGVTTSLNSPCPSFVKGGNPICSSPPKEIIHHCQYSFSRLTAGFRMRFPPLGAGYLAISPNPTKALSY